MTKSTPEEPLPPSDDRSVVERENRARAEGERVASERFAIEKSEIEERFEAIRMQFEREVREQLENERARLQAEYDRYRASLKESLERDTAQEIGRIRSAAEERITGLRAELDRLLAAQDVAASETRRGRSSVPPPQEKGIFGGLFKRGAEQPERRQRPAGEDYSTRRARAPKLPSEKRVRLLFVESRRAMAEAASTGLKTLGIDTMIVERLTEAIEALDRFRPDIAFIDAELSDFPKVYRTMTEQTLVPLVLTARNASSIPMVRRAGVATRPYDIDEIVELARTAADDPQSLLAKQAMQRE